MHLECSTPVFVEEVSNCHANQIRNDAAIRLDVHLVEKQMVGILVWI